MKAIIVTFFVVTLSIFGFSQNSEVELRMVPTGEVLNEYDTIYNLEIIIDRTALQGSTSVDLFVNGTDSVYTVQAVSINPNMAPNALSNPSQNSNRFAVHGESTKIRVVMAHARPDMYEAEIIITSSNGQSRIKKKIGGQ